MHLQGKEVGGLDLEFSQKNLFKIRKKQDSKILENSAIGT